MAAVIFACTGQPSERIYAVCAAHADGRIERDGAFHKASPLTQSSGKWRLKWLVVQLLLEVLSPFLQSQTEAVAHPDCMAISTFPWRLVLVVQIPATPDSRFTKDIHLLVQWSLYNPAPFVPRKSAGLGRVLD